MGSQAPRESAIDQIRTRRGQSHRKWRQAMIKLCRHVARDDGMHVNRIPMHSALICIKDFERINGVTFDPSDSGHRWKVELYAREARLFWVLAIRRAKWSVAHG